MIRYVWLGLRLALIMGIAVWFSEHPGKVKITWQNYLLETSVGALLLLMVLTLGLIFLASRLMRDVLRLPTRWSLHREAQAGRRGRRQLVGGLVAVASGDAVEARRLSRQTEAAAVDPVLSHLLAAEALILAGDNDAAESQFEMLLGREDTIVIGYRGLIEVALARGDWLKAYARAKKARATMPKSPWLLGLLIDLAVRAGELEEAARTLALALRLRVFTPGEAKRRHRALLVSQAQQAEREGLFKEALGFAEKGLEIDSAFVPAATLAARLHLRNDRARVAEKILERAWAQNPHADIIDVWKRLAPVGDALGTANWMRRLREAHPKSQDAALAHAEAAIAARLWSDARGDLEQLIAAGPSANHSARGAYALMAQLEREEKGSLAAAVSWYERLDATALEPRWACHACGHVTAWWREICEECGAFAQMDTPDTNALVRRSLGEAGSLPGIGSSLRPQSSVAS